MKGDDRYMEIILVAFAKKFLLGANGSFRTQKGTSSQLLICCKECFTILYNERGQERHENYTNGFYDWAIWSFFPKMERPHNFGS